MKRIALALAFALYAIPALAQLGPGGSNLGPSGGGSGGGVPAGSIAVGTTAITGGTTARVLFDNGGFVGEYTNTQLTALINPATTALSGALPAWPNNTTTFFRGDGTYTALNLAAFPTQATNTVLGNATSGTAVPAALAVGTCSTASSALIWTTNTGFGCNTSITASSIPVSGITGLGTGVATALAVNVGSAGAFVTFNGAGGTPSSITLTSATGLPVATGISGLGTGVATALAVNVGSAGAFVTFNGALGTPSSGTATNLTGLPLSGLSTQATNTVVGNATSGTASPTALAVGTCSTASSALIWTTNTGFGCNTSITAAAVPASGLTGATLASGVTASSLTSVGTLTSLTTSGAITSTSNTPSVIGTNNTASSAAELDLYGGNGTAGGGNLRFGANGAVAVYIGTPSSILGGAYNTDFLVYMSGMGGATGALRIANATGNLTAYAALLAPNLAATSAAQTGTLCWTTGTGNVTVDTTTTCLLSSARFKHDIRPLEGSLKTVMALKPVSYEYNDPTIKGVQIGFVAEDVANLDDRLVSREPDGSPRAVRYQQLTAALAGAIQAQQKQIDALRSRNWCLAGWCW